MPEKLFSSNLEREKVVHISLEQEKRKMTANLEPKTTVSRLIGKEKSGFQLLGAPKLYFTTLWSKQKEDNCYFKSEKLVHSYLEYEKNGSQLFVN